MIENLYYKIIFLFARFFFIIFQYWMHRIYLYNCCHSREVFLYNHNWVLPHFFFIHGRKIFLEDDSFNFVSFVCPKEMILVYFYIISQFFYSCNLIMRSLEGTIIVREVIKWQNNNKFHINPENTY